jgi:hypothetical protein
MPRPPHFSPFDHPNNIWWWVQIIKFHACTHTCNLQLSQLLTGSHVCLCRGTTHSAQTTQHPTGLSRQTLGSCHQLPDSFWTSCTYSCLTVWPTTKQTSSSDISKVVHCRYH